jgi:hypothetical protein
MELQHLDLQEVVRVEVDSASKGSGAETVPGHQVMAAVLRLVDCIEIINLIRSCFLAILKFVSVGRFWMCREAFTSLHDSRDSC